MKLEKKGFFFIFFQEQKKFHLHSSVSNLPIHCAVLYFIISFVLSVPNSKKKVLLLIRFKSIVYRNSISYVDDTYD